MKGSSLKVRFEVNGQVVSPDLPGSTLLLYFLRNDLQLNGPKYGCGLGECGACSVIIDGTAARSCILPLSVLEGKSVVTLEGLGRDGRPDPVQQAFIDEQAAQCGYCINGMIVTVRALLERSPNPDDAEIRRELSGNLCRCGTHIEILRAVRRAIELRAAEGIAP